jgi:hypothetical protein
MDIVSLFIPDNADFLRDALNNIADLSEKKGFQQVAARVSSLVIPIIALFNAVSFASEGKFLDAIRLTSFIFISMAWSIAGLIAGSKVLTIWREVFIPTDNFAAFEKLFEHLLEKGTPIGSIVNRKGALSFSPKKMKGPPDPFSASVLSHLLIRGHQKFQMGEIYPEEFDTVLGTIKKMVGNDVPGESLEAKNLAGLLDHYLAVRATGEHKFIQSNEDISLGCLIDTLCFQKSWQDHVVRTPFFSREIVVEVLSDRFGEDFVKEILTFYPLTGEVWSEKDVVALLIGLAANLTLADARVIFKTDIESELIEKISILRDSLSKFAEDHKIIPGPTWEKQLNKDLDCLKSMKYLLDVAGKEYPFGKDQERFACYEHLARHLIYYLFDPPFSNFRFNGSGITRFREGTLVTLTGIRTEPRLYQIKLIIRDGGVNGVYLVPANGDEGDEGFVVFRGTSDLASISRDLAVWERNSLELWPEGPGSASFARRRQIILEKWGELKQLYPQIKHWNFFGHSLGGSDVARVVAMIANKKENNLEGIKSVNVITYNAPKVESWTNLEFLSGVEKLVNQCQFSETNLVGDGDPIHKFGISRLGQFKTSKPRNLQTETITFEQANAKGIYGCHTTPWLTPTGDPTPKSEEDRVRLIVCMARLARS